MFGAGCLFVPWGSGWQVLILSSASFRLVIEVSLKGPSVEKKKKRRQQKQKVQAWTRVTFFSHNSSSQYLKPAAGVCRQCSRSHFTGEAIIASFSL